MKLEFSRQISKSPQISHLVKIPPMWAELFLADRQTDGRSDRPTWRS